MWVRVPTKTTHCSKSSFFVQKFNFDFPRKLLIFWVKNSWKCCGFGLFSCWQLWFHEKNCQKKFGWKTRENVVVLDILAVDNFDFTRKIVTKNLDEKLVKMLRFCQNWIFGQKLDFSNSIIWRLKFGLNFARCFEIFVNKVTQKRSKE